LAVLYGCQPDESTTAQNVGSAMRLCNNLLQTVQPHHPSSSADAMKLAKDIGCLACHSIEKKLLGPAWKTVAAIYRNNPAAEAQLMDKIAKGGSGVWGKIAMPAYPDLDEAKSRTLVKFILSLE
jgi:cytochrome c